MGQYGQPNPYGQPGGYGYPPQKKSPMPWILAGGGVVVVAVVVVLIIVLTGGGGTSSPQDLAESAVSAANSQDYDGLADLACNADKEDVKKAADPSAVDPSLKDVKAEFTLGNVSESGDTAKAEVTMKITGLPKEYGNVGDIKGSLNMKKESGDWCISGFSR